MHTSSLCKRPNCSRWRYTQVVFVLNQLVINVILTLQRAFHNLLRMPMRNSHGNFSCGRHAPPLIFSATSVLQLTSSAIVQSQYFASFSLRYRILSDCNRTIDIDKGSFSEGSSLASGRLTSPNYPNPYSHNSTCTT